MRAITVRQPWAWAIIHGGKDVENRTRNVAGSYRGPVAIHAGVQWSSQGEHSELVARAYFADRERQGWTVVDREGAPRRAAALGLGKFLKPAQFGAFVGVVDLVDVHQAHPEEHAFGNTWAAACCSSPWGQSDAGVHLVLENPRPLPELIPARGRLGLWTPDAGSLLRLQEAVKAA